LWHAVQLDAEREKKLALKPATLEEAIKTAVASRVAAERCQLTAAYTVELDSLRQQLALLQGK
jgi:hypothetical protein